MWVRCCCLQYWFLCWHLVTFVFFWLLALVFVMSWFTSALAFWLGFFGVGFSGIMTHGVYLELIMGLPNHSPPTLLLGGRQSVQMCDCPSDPGKSISSGVVAFWLFWIVRWQHKQLFRMRCCLSLESAEIIHYFFVPLIEDEFLGFMLCCGLSLRIHVFPTEVYQNIFRILSGWAVDAIERLQRITHMRVKKLNSSYSVIWLCILRLVLERCSNSSNFSDAPSKVRFVVVAEFGNLEIRLMMLPIPAELVLLANCWRTTKIWSASIVARLFSLRNCGWPV